MLFGTSNGLTCDLDSLTWLLPGTLVDHQTNPDNPPPSLQPHYRAFLTTTRRSVPLPRISTLPLTVSAARGSPFRRRRQHASGAITARGSHVSCQRLYRARATSVPGNRQGSKQVSPWLFPGQQLDPGYDCRRYAYDTSAVVHSRSPSRSPPDASRAPFPWCSSPRLIHRSNPRWFTASPCRAAVEGLPPSPAQHRDHQRDLLHRNLQSRSWRTIVRVADEPVGGAAAAAVRPPPVLVAMSVPLGAEMLIQRRQGDVGEQRRAYAPNAVGNFCFEV